MNDTIKGFIQAGTVGLFLATLMGTAYGSDAFFATALFVCFMGLLSCVVLLTIADMLADQLSIKVELAVTKEVEKIARG